MNELIQYLYLIILFLTTQHQANPSSNQSINFDKYLLDIDITEPIVTKSNKEIVPSFLMIICSAEMVPAIKVNILPVSPMVLFLQKLPHLITGQYHLIIIIINEAYTPSI